MKTTAIVKNGIIEPSDKRVLQEGAHLIIEEDFGSSTIEDRPLKTKKQVIEFALEIFRNNKTVVRSWLSSPNGALNNAMPIDLLDTPEGIEEVGDVLGRMATGVYS
jgi:putative toxin-antitoxin system antitoxin component (TIGR02293 family)